MIQQSLMQYQRQRRSHNRPGTKGMRISVVRTRDWGNTVIHYMHLGENQIFTIIKVEKDPCSNIVPLDLEERLRLYQMLLRPLKPQAY